MVHRSVIFRFYEELNDFLPVERRKREFAVEMDRGCSVKEAIEACGVPHPEVDLILVDGRSVDFGHGLRGGERLAVYPMFESLDITPVLRLRPRPLRDPRFAADRHLRMLARRLRLAGFDTLWDGDWADERIVAIAAREKRTILTRDRDLLRRGDVDRGYYVRATRSAAQLAEVVQALQLEGLLSSSGARPSAARTPRCRKSRA